MTNSRLKLQSTFNCPVCGDEFRSHLAMSCVNMPGKKELNRSAETHSFCAECVRGYAKAAGDQNVIVRSGIGIKCMESECECILLR
ncbi:hypothetical protein PFISCL1PPCAC_16740, partial [Pristionchus fissidentatus]